MTTQAIVIEGDRPESIEPIPITLTGWYQSDPGDLPAGADWREAQWRETIRFVAVGKWEDVNRIIANVGINEEGTVLISGGVDLTRFMVGNAIEDDKKAMQALLSNPHKVITRKTIAMFTLALIEAYSGGKASIA